MRRTDNETEMNLAAKESGLFISRAIDQLPEQRKMIFRLNREKHLNYHQIAETLRISRHTVKNQVSTALHQIKAFLKDLRLF
jgi:RNA polymerase sigma factor (sigma-70 family)